ncbi:MAG TPA: HYR domain-containing protein [Saprospiraceae bacterium]|nr:HYR domain-containing protein [Saprospiraceae bacterium]
MLTFVIQSFALAPPANDDCANAINLTSGATCIPTAGTNVEATQSIPAITCGIFTSSSALDVWYKFTATATAHTITVAGGTGFDAIIDVRSGACNGTNIGCADATTGGGIETVTLGGLSIGQVYLIRVYGWAGGTGSFTICVTSAPTGPANDDCANATNLTSGTTCVNTSGTNVAATQSIAPITCASFTSSSALDVWYKFTAVATSHTIKVVGGTGFDAIIDVRSGACNGTNIGCADATTTGGTEMVTVSGLTIGNVYLVRVYGWSGGTGTFSICVTHTAPAGPANDDCANATTLTPGTTCTPTNGTTVGGTQSIAAITCATFTGTADDDVWYKFIATSTNHNVTVVGGAGFDAVVDVRSGACNGTNIGCADATISGGTEVVTLTGLTVGTTYLVRVYSFSSLASGQGTFTICVTIPAPANNDCGNASTLTPAAGCTPTNGTTVGATQSIAAITCATFTGTADDDVWYKFVATSANHNVTVVGGAGFDAVVDVRTGACNGTNIGCADATVSGGTETVTLSGLSVGTTYLVRVYSFGSLASNQGTFTICVTTPGGTPVCPPNPTSPNNGQVVCPSPSTILSWPSVAGATSYDVYFGTSAIPPFVANTASTTFLAPTPTNTSYFWQIRPVGPGGTATGCTIWTFSLGDVTPPSITCPSNVTANVSPTTSCSAVVTYGSVGATDNCTAPSIVLVSGQASGSSFPVGTSTIVYRATDSAGNTMTCSFTVTVIDNQPPSITCPANVTANAAQGTCAAVVTYGSTSATDNCTAPAITLVSGQASGSSFPVGVNTIVFRASDAAGNSSTCAFTVRVFDTQIPTISCPAAITVQCASTVPAASVGSVTANDNCGAPTVTFLGDVISNQTCANKYTITRYYRATDPSGNSASCSQSIIVNDNTAPVITFTAPLIANVPNGGRFDIQCLGQDPNWELPTFGTNSVSVTDNCGTPTVTYNIVLQDEGNCPVDGYITLYKLTWTATDACGNSSSKFVFMGLVDHIPPVLHNVPANITVNCDEIPDPPTNVFATDECIEASEVQFHSTPVPNGCQDGVVITRTWSSTDACGNKSTGTQLITLIDDTPPALQFIPAELQNVGNGTVLQYTCNEGGFPEFYDDLNAASVFSPASCGSNAIIKFDKSTIHPVNCARDGYLEQQTFHWNAVDNCGNETNLTIYAQLIDTEAPMIVGVPDTTCIGDPSLKLVEAVDNCDNGFLSFFEVKIPNPCGAGFGVRRTYEANDGCDNFTRDTVILIPNDHGGPVMLFVNPILAALSPGENLTIDCAGQNGDYTPFSAEDVSVDDSCTGVNVTYKESVTQSNGCTEGIVAAVLMQWQASDLCGNISNLSVQATVVDHTSPELVNFKSEITIACHDVPPSINAIDNCGNADLVVNETRTNGQCESEYTLTRIITATDPCGNVTNATQIVHVGDGSGPVIHGVVPEICDDLSIPKITASDPCTGKDVIVSMSEKVLPEQCRDGVIYERTWTATDACGHTSTIKQLIIVGDKTPPEFQIPTYSIILKYLDAPGKSYVNLSQTDIIKQLDDLDDGSVFVTDECDEQVIPHFNLEVTFNGNCQDDGYSERRVYTWWATDICGNTSSVSFDVYILDDFPPSMIGIPEDVTIICAQLPAPPTVHATDPSQPVSIQYSQTITFGVQGPGIADVVRTWTATDACGNVASQNQHITWIPDTFIECQVSIPPGIECNSHDVVIGSNITGGLGAVTYEWEVLGQGFIESGQGTSQINIYVGWTEVTIVLTVKDAYGCTSVCSDDIDCIDTEINPFTQFTENVIPDADQTLTLKVADVSDAISTISGLMLWPNPVNSSLNISFISATHQDVSYRLMNNLGQTMMTDKMNANKGPNSQRIDVSKMSAGSYILELKSESGTYTKVIVIMRND